MWKVLGTVAPGSSNTAGVITIEGNYTQDASGILSINLGGTSPGTQSSELVVTGQANLGGTLQMQFIGNYTPSLTNNDTIKALYASFTTTFSTYQLPTRGTVTVAPYYQSHQLNLLAVLSGDIDFLDQPRWRRLEHAFQLNTDAVPVSTDNAYINTASPVNIAYADTGVTDSVNELTSHEKLDISAGPLIFGGTTTIFGSLTLDGGTLDANGTVTVSGGFIFTSGTLEGSSGLDSSGGLDISSGGAKTINTAVSNSSTLTVNGSDNLDLGTAAVLTNQPGGTIDWQGSGSITGAGTILNEGTFERTTSTSPLTIDAAFTNVTGGVISAQSGTIDFTGGLTQTGGTIDLAGGNIESPTTIQFEGGVIMDSGTIFANVNQTGGAMEPGPDPGIININGNYTLNAASVVNIEIDGTSNADVNNPQFDQVVVTGTASLAGTLNITEGGGFMAAAGQGLPDH